MEHFNLTGRIYCGNKKKHFPKTLLTIFLLNRHYAVQLLSNGITQHLSPDSQRRLGQICNAVELTAGQVLEPDDSNERPVYFLVNAVVSLWIEPEPGAPRLALSLVGQEGMAGCSQLWHDKHSQWVTRVLKPGLAFKTDAAALQELLLRTPDLALGISRFLWSQTLELAQLSARMQQGDIRTRLALWLHLMQHKTGTQTLRITQQTLADMLGIRRVSITLTAGTLQSEGILALRRGEIQITDLAGLARAASVAC